MLLRNKISKLKTLGLIMLACAGLFSCAKEHRDPGGSGAEGSNEVRIHIHTPGSSLPKAKSSDADENVISSVKVLVFQKSGNDYKYEYMTDGRQIAQEGLGNEITTFTALLTSSTEPLRLILVANAADAFDTANIMADMTDAQVRKLLNDSFDPDNIAGQLPMYGEIDLDELVTDKTVSTPVTTTMLRSVARVDVVNDLTGFSEDFILQSVYIYRANDKIQLIPDKGNLASEGSFSVTTASVPSGASFRSTNYYKQDNSEPESITKLYVPESAAVTDAGQQLLRATCIVVGGLFGPEKTLGYYRINFDSGIDGHPFGQVLRNHKYVFNIKEVYDPGFTDPDAAANNDASSMIATIQVWNEATSQMYFSDGDHYLGISSRVIPLCYKEGSEYTAYLESTVPFVVQALQSDGETLIDGTAINTAGQSFENDFFRLEMIKENSDGENIHRLFITALQDNWTEDDFTGYFRVSTGNWIFNVTVIQDTYLQEYLDRYIHVLTITGLEGELGTAEGTFTHANSGVAMRRVLDNPANFSPTGWVKVGGVVVHSFPKELIASENAYEMDLLRKMLQHMDVVHLGGDCPTSQKASELIIDWKRSSPYRILFLGLDPDEDTNKTLRDDFTEDGVWRAITAPVYTLGNIYPEEGEEPLMNGTFGDVKRENLVVNTTDRPVTYNYGYNSETTVPILRVNEGNDGNGMVTHGVNFETGVFYFGFSDIFSSSGGMSDQAEADGTISSDFDILMGNIWAWIIERIVVAEMQK